MEQGSPSPVSRPTMRDVARTAGVSLKTVSRVINEEAGVAASTASRVSEAIELLGFERNDLARSLRRGHSSATLGLVIEDLANPFYSAMAQAVEAAARERGYLLITASALEDPGREREVVAAMLRRRVDALLVVPAGPDHRYVAAAGGHTPVVFLDRPPGGLDADTVLHDNRGGARQAVEHLLKHGHTRIACVADSAELYTAGRRLAGHREALAAAGAVVDPALVRTGNRDAAQSQAAVEELLALPEGIRPTALFTANNRNTIGALRALSGHGARLALVGFDDFELADLLGVTIVRSLPTRMGTEAAALVFARLGGDRRPPQHVTIPYRLVSRGTGEVRVRSAR
jgi:LacI family transcriptional regulator